MHMLEIPLWYVALAEDKIFFGKAPVCESGHLLPNLIRQMLEPRLTLSSIKTEVFISCKPIHDPHAAEIFCEDKKHIPRGEYKFLEVIHVDFN